MDLGTTTVFLSGENPPREKHPFLMYDSIFQTAHALQACLEPLRYAGIAEIAKEFKARRLDQVTITGCGTSLNAGRVLAWAFERIAGMPARAVDSLEFQLLPPSSIGNSMAVLGVSHSGNSITTVQAVELARGLGAYTVSLAGNPAGKLAQVTDTAILDPLEQEFPRPKTRSYSATCFQGILLANLVASQGKGLPVSAEDLDILPGLVQDTIVKVDGAIPSMIHGWGKAARHYMVAGSGVDVGHAYEIALKLMETIGLPATGFELEEFTHGPGYCLDSSSAVVLFQTNPLVLYRSLQAANAVLASGSRLLVITNQPGEDWPEGSLVVSVPKLESDLYGLLSILPAQLLVYYLALERGQNPDVAMNNRENTRQLARLMFPPGTH